jgi:Asp-tRNA(Asn)/Glu-tRNA(Gln) amidotransferase A subunit family amidase
VQIVGLPWTETSLLAMAYAYEQATHHRHPPSTTP